METGEGEEHYCASERLRRSLELDKLRRHLANTITKDSRWPTLPVANIKSNNSNSNENNNRNNNFLRHRKRAKTNVERELPPKQHHRHKRWLPSEEVSCDRNNRIRLNSI